METVVVIVIVGAAAAGVGYGLYRGVAGRGGCANCSGQCRSGGACPGGRGEAAQAEDHTLSGIEKK